MSILITSWIILAILWSLFIRHRNEPLGIVVWALTLLITLISCIIPVRNEPADPIDHELLEGKTMRVVYYTPGKTKHWKIIPKDQNVIGWERGRSFFNIPLDVEPVIK